jgi:hypothetical protein
MIERNDLRVGSLFMNAREYADIRRSMRDALDVGTHREILATGLMGTLWGAQVFVSSVFPAGRIYMTAEPDLVGRMPLRDIVVLSADDPLNLQIGWATSENVGICCSNPLGVACISIAQ